MAKWGRTDFNQLKELKEKLDKLSNADFDAFCQKAAKQLAAILLAKVKRRTPVGVVPESIWQKRDAKVTDKDGNEIPAPEVAIYKKYWEGYQGGTLRRGWYVTEIQKQGDVYTISVANNTEYAPYVEYGHRQTPGRFVPALGKTLTKSFVPGKYMLTMSSMEVEKLAPAKLEALFSSFLKEQFNA